MIDLSRRAWAVGISLAACTRKEVKPDHAPQRSASASSSIAVSRPPVPEFDAGDAASAPATTTRVVEWDLGPRGKAIVLVSPARSGERMPLVVALHGRGESLKGPARGPWGWPRDYALERAMNRIAAPPLTRADWEGLTTDERLRKLNERLASKPFGGLVVISPFLPDFDWSRPPSAVVETYGRFLVDELLPKARAELPVIATAAATGIDGVSLGGCMALRVGFRFVDHFGAVGSLQGALNPGQVEELVNLARAARHKRATLGLRIATSKEDSFVNSNHALSRALTAGGVAHQFEDHLGPHDYVWNRGPGSYELLTFHDATLARS